MRSSAACVPAAGGAAGAVHERAAGHRLQLGHPGGQSCQPHGRRVPKGQLMAVAPRSQLAAEIVMVHAALAPARHKALKRVQLGTRALYGWRVCSPGARALWGGSACSSLCPHSALYKTTCRSCVCVAVAVAAGGTTRFLRRRSVRCDCAPRGCVPRCY